jgi:hypothetical protein
MRPILLALALAAVLAACGISQSTTAPLQPALTPGPSEQPTSVIDVVGRNGHPPMRLSVYDRSLAVTSIRSATADELLGLAPLDWNAVGAAGIGDRHVVVTWAARDGDDAGTLIVGPGVDRIVVLPTSDEVAEASREIRGVVVAFKLPVNMESVDFLVQPVTA